MITYYRPIRVTLIGELNNPGVYTLPFKISNYGVNSGEIKFEYEDFKYQPTIIDALQISGGITPNSNLKEIDLIRRVYEKNNIVNKTIKINLVELFLKGKLENNIMLFDGDIIKINKSLVQNQNYHEVINANLSPRNIPIYVVGEVKNPGLINVPSNTTLLDSILIAGGPLNSRLIQVKLKLSLSH